MRGAAWLARLRRHGPGVIVAWLLLALTSPALRLLSMPRVQAALKRMFSGRRVANPPRSTQETAVRRATQWAKRVAFASRCLALPTRCLERSLVLQALLAREGIETELRIGVLRGEHGLAAHAWLELNGEAVGESDEALDSFSTLQSPGVSLEDQEPAVLRGRAVP